MSGISQTAIDKANESLWKERYSGSETFLKKAIAGFKKSELKGYQKGMAAARVNIAAISFYRSDNKTALKNISQAARWFERSGDDIWHTRSLLIKGNIHESFGDYEMALTHWLTAHESAFRIKDLELESESCSQLGLIYTRLCNFPKALEYYNKSLLLRQETGDENGAASTHNRLGMVYRQMKRYDESLEHYYRALEIRKRRNLSTAVPWTLLGIASTCEQMNNPQEALKYYESGIADEDRRCRLQCLLGAGRVYSMLGIHDKAEEYISSSLRLSKELKSLSLAAECYSALSSHFEQAGEPVKALKFYKLYLKTRESLQGSELQSRLSNLGTAHAVEKSEQEKEIYRLRNIELKKAYDIIEENNREITASIRYAVRIQKAILPSVREIKEPETALFILYLPKDIVSGDFYWFTEADNRIFLVAADCTGHGVPGALMSILGIRLLEDIIIHMGITSPPKILDELSSQVRKALKQKGESGEARDGMDISLAVINRDDKTIEFSGAHNNICLISKNKLTEYYADRISVGYTDQKDERFSAEVINVARGDILYMYSDGFADQFGGPNNKRLKSAGLRELLQKHHKKPLQMQKKNLEAEFNKWKGDNPQTDDVLIIGYRV